jgi:hypothetical protein
MVFQYSLQVVGDGIFYLSHPRGTPRRFPEALENGKPCIKLEHRVVEDHGSYLGQLLFSSTSHAEAPFTWTGRGVSGFSAVRHL